MARSKGKGLKGLIVSLASIIVVCAIAVAIFFISPAGKTLKAVGALKDSLKEDASVQSYTIDGISYYELQGDEEGYKIYIIEYTTVTTSDNQEVKTSDQHAYYYADGESAYLEYMEIQAQRLFGGSVPAEVKIGKAGVFVAGLVG